MAGALSMAPAFAQTAPDRSANPDTRGSATSNPSTAPSYANPNTNPGTAANSGQTVPGTDMNSPSRTDADYNNHHSFNFGWVGLVGLVGLLGLRRGHGDRYDDPRNINNTGPGGIR